MLGAGLTALIRILTLLAALVAAAWGLWRETDAARARGNKEGSSALAALIHGLNGVWFSTDISHGFKRVGLWDKTGIYCNFYIFRNFRIDLQPPFSILADKTWLLEFYRLMFEVLIKENGLETYQIHG